MKMFLAVGLALVASPVVAQPSAKPVAALDDWTTGAQECELVLYQGDRRLAMRGFGRFFLVSISGLPFGIADEPDALSLAVNGSPVQIAGPKHLPGYQLIQFYLAKSDTVRWGATTEMSLSQSGEGLAVFKFAQAQQVIKKIKKCEEFVASEP